MISIRASGLCPRWCALIATAFLLQTTAPIAAVEFIPLGHLPGRLVESEAFGISGDGRVVVGESGREAFRWTAEEGMIGLGDLPGGRFESRANAVSFDGSVIVGRSHIDDGTVVAFRWTESEGMLALPRRSKYSTEAIDISADGASILGHNAEPNQDVVMWRRDLGLVYIPYPEGGWDGVHPTAISANGSVVVGHMWITSSTTPFRWIDGVGADIFALPNLNIYVHDISTDGSIIIGEADVGNDIFEGFRWTESEGLVGIPPPAGMDFSGAIAVSADGGVMAGYMGREVFDSWEENIHASVWEADHGWRRVDEILTHGGVDLTGWHLSWAQDISADGRVVVGRGINPDGNTEAWMAVIPEPSTLAMCLPLAVIGAVVLRRKSACCRRR